MSIFQRLKKNGNQKPDSGQGTSLKKEETKVTEAVKNLPPSDLKPGLMGDSRMILKPLVTEKSSYYTNLQKYFFVVRPETTKIQVKTAIKQMYGVTPLFVNMVNISGKRVRFGKTKGLRKSWKKAIVTLPHDSKINPYEGI